MIPQHMENTETMFKAEPVLGREREISTTTTEMKDVEAHVEKNFQIIKRH